MITSITSGSNTPLIARYEQLSKMSAPKANAVATTTVQQKTGSSTTTTDTVNLSNAALAAYQEATETPAQTAQEARSGDPQAQRLLTREAAAEKLLSQSYGSYAANFYKVK